MKTCYTISEYIAYKLMTQNEVMESNLDPHMIHEKANELILLAEKIKAERAISAMQK